MNQMSSALCFTPLSPYNAGKLRTSFKNSSVMKELKFPGSERKYQIFLKGMNRNDEGINGSGNGNGNGNGNEGNEDSEFNSPEKYTGLEWWKWQQTRQRSNAVDGAVQVVANGVKETIKPAVRAIVLGPIRERVTNIQSIVLLMVLGAFVLSCLQMLAGLAMVSSGVTLAGFIVVVLGMLWRPWGRKLGHGKTDFL